MSRPHTAALLGALVAWTVLAVPAVAQSAASSGRIVVPALKGAGAGLPLPPLLGAPVLRQRTIAEGIAEQRQRRRALDGTGVELPVPAPARRGAGEPRAFEGRAALDRARAGAFARSGPAAIGASPVSRMPTGSRR